MPQLTLTTVDGVNLHARWWDGGPSASTAVVLVHGFTGSKDHPEVVAVAEALSASGHHVLSYDARGHNESEGLCTLGDAESKDVAAAVAYARTRAGRVVTVGASMGGIAVVRHAAGDPHLSGVVTVSAPALWRLPRNVKAALATVMTRTRLGRSLAARVLGVRIHPVWTNPVPPAVLAGTIRVPLAVIHGDADTIVPAAEARELVAGARGPALLDIVRGMRHAFDAPSIPAIQRAVAWTLGPSHATPIPA